MTEGAHGPRSWRIAAPQSFGGRLLVVAGIAALVRVAYALTLAPPLSFLDDDTFFHGTAALLATGHGYVRPLDLLFHHQSIATAEHPPLYPLLLSLLPRLGLDSLGAERMVGVVCGTGTVVVVAFIARRLAGEREGLIAGGLCAVYPSFIAADGALMSESLFGLLVALAVLETLRLWARPSMGRALGVGGLVGLGALARSEGLLLVPLLGVAVLPQLSGRRLRLGGLALVAAIAVLAPWLARNWEVFGRPTLSTNEGTLVAGSNCRRTYYGSNLGGFDFSCLPPGILGSAGHNEAIWSARLTDSGSDYVGRHVGRGILVGAARLARVWGLYRPGAQGMVTGRRGWVQRLGVAVFYVVALLGLLGLRDLRRRRAERYIVAAPLLLSSIVAVVSYGTVRFRHEGEVMLIVLAGVALTARARRLGARRGSRASSTVG